jgi:hypothetical protein
VLERLSGIGAQLVGEQRANEECKWNETGDERRRLEDPRRLPATERLETEAQ